MGLHIGYKCKCQQNLERAQLKGPVPRDRLIRKRDRYVAGNGQLVPYCQVVVWWLDQRIARMDR